MHSDAFQMAALLVSFALIAVVCAVIYAVAVVL